MKSGKYSGPKVICSRATTRIPAKARPSAVQRTAREDRLQAEDPVVPHATMLADLRHPVSSPRSARRRVVQGLLRPAADARPDVQRQNIIPRNNSNWPQPNDPKINAAMDKAATLRTTQRAQGVGRDRQADLAAGPAVPVLWDKQPNAESKDVHGVINDFNCVVGPLVHVAEVGATMRHVIEARPRRRETAGPLPSDHPTHAMVRYIIRRLLWVHRAARSW